MDPLTLFFELLQAHGGLSASLVAAFLFAYFWKKADLELKESRKLERDQLQVVLKAVNVLQDFREVALRGLPPRYVPENPEEFSKEQHS